MNNEYCIVQRILAEAELDRLGKDMQNLEETIEEEQKLENPVLGPVPASDNSYEISTPDEIVDVGTLRLEEEVDFDVSGLSASERDKVFNQEHVPEDFEARNIEDGPGSQEHKEAGYYTYTRAETKFGTERTIWRIETVGKILAKQNITMGVGNISLKGGGTLKPHASHKRGVDVDLRFINSAGMAGSCNLKVDRSCFDSEKTFQMIKAYIDVDPNSVRAIFVNDDKLLADINAYYKKVSGRDIQVAKRCPGHDNHVHISWNQ
jgi:hypothetical protein